MNLQTKQKEVQTRVDTLLEQKLDALPQHANTLKEAMKYSLLMGGKRMRPLLVYITGEMLGLPPSQIENIALAIECIHAYSLIHDDLPAMDNDDMRRGHPTCHIKFDEATAILAGDALQTLAFEILASTDSSKDGKDTRVELIKMLAQASGYNGMCGGQAMDLAATNQNIERQQLESLHQKKTGALLSIAILMPATAAQADSTTLISLQKFAQYTGLAFQVQDDILDVIGDSQVLGKPQGSDQAQNKSTYPALLGLDGATNYLHELHQQALQALRSLPYNTLLLQSFADYNVNRNH